MASPMEERPPPFANDAIRHWREHGRYSCVFCGTAQTMHEEFCCWPCYVEQGRPRRVHGGPTTIPVGAGSGYWCPEPEPSWDNIVRAYEDTSILDSREEDP